MISLASVAIVNGAISMPVYPHSRAKAKARSNGQSRNVSLQMANFIGSQRKSFESG